MIYCIQQHSVTFWNAVFFFMALTTDMTRKCSTWECIQLGSFYWHGYRMWYEHFDSCSLMPPKSISVLPHLSTILGCPVFYSLIFTLFITCCQSVIVHSRVEHYLPDAQLVSQVMGRIRTIYVYVCIYISPHNNQN